MKKLMMSLVSAAFVLLSFSSVMATTITFNEALVGDFDPTIGAVSFFAGDGLAFNDTYVTDSWTPTNNYLLSGKNDGTNPNVATWWQTDFIGAALNLSDSRFDTITFDIAIEEILPGNSNSIVYGFVNSAGSGFGGVKLFSWDENHSYRNYQTLTIANTADYDYFSIFSYNLSQLDNVETGAFHIDNFTYTTKPIDGTPAVPEPSTIILLGLGLAGCAVWRKRRG